MISSGGLIGQFKSSLYEEIRKVKLRPRETQQSVKKAGERKQDSDSEERPEVHQEIEKIPDGRKTSETSGTFGTTQTVKTMFA